MKGTRKWDIIIEGLMRMKVDFEEVVNKSTEQEVTDDYCNRINEIVEIYHWCVGEWYECKIAEDAESKKYEVRNDD